MGAAEVQDGDQNMFLDEAQRLEGQDTLDILWGDKNPPFRACSAFLPLLFSLM